MHRSRCTPALYKSFIKKEGKLELHTTAERLLALRSAAHWSREDLADKSGVGVSIIARIEYGESSPRLSTIYALSKALNVEPDYLVCWETCNAAK